jgi:hypothetical protein
MDEIIIKEDKKKVLQLIILGIIMLTISFLNLAIGITNANVFYIIIGIIGTAFFGYCFFYIIKRATNNKPLLIISETGITDISNASSIGFVPWEEIKSVSIIKVLSQKFIGITVYDLDKLINGLPLFKRIIIMANLKLKYPPINITLSTSNMELSEVLSLMQNQLHNRQLKECYFGER